MADPPLPRSGSLLTLPEPPVLTLHVWRDEDALCLRLLNASDGPVSAMVGSAVLRITSASRCDLFGVASEELALEDDAVVIDMDPRSMATLRLRVRRA